MNISVLNIRDMLYGDQEELLRAYIDMYSCEIMKDGTMISFGILYLMVTACIYGSVAALNLF